MLLDAVARPDGATLEDLNAASGWLPHTRAAITRRRQRGYDVRLATTGTRKAYHLAVADLLSDYAVTRDQSRACAGG